MKKIFLIVLCLVTSLALFGQEMAPSWVNTVSRERAFSPETFLTGFVVGSMRAGETLATATARIEKDAQGKLTESIRVKVESEAQSQTHSVRDGNGERVSSSFESAVKTMSNLEIVGTKVESYYNKGEDVIYAFAYANKYELAGYYKANIGMLVQQAEGNLTTAEQLEQGGEKSKARKQCEEAIPLFAKIRYAQDLLTAIDAADSESLQQAKSEDLRSKATQMLARLAQGLYVYVESKESNFGQSSNVLTNKVKAILASKGCSFTDNAENADLKLKLLATTREISNSGSIVFCYADVEIELYDNRKQKVVFNDELSQKGGSSTNERAGRKALEDAVSVIAGKISPWIE